MGILVLPPLGYLWPNKYLFGPWREIGVPTAAELPITLRHGWVVQIRQGTTSTDKPFLELQTPGVATSIQTSRKPRLAFRARVALDADNGSYEELTEKEAWRRHPDCDLVEVASIVDNSGGRRNAIFVWDAADHVHGVEEGNTPRAVYWLGR